MSEYIMDPSLNRCCFRVLNYAYNSVYIRTILNRCGVAQ